MTNPTPQPASEPNWKPNPYHGTGCLAVTHKFCAHADPDFHFHVRLDRRFTEVADPHSHEGGSTPHEHSE
jgi:hypothetical protein